MSYIILLSSNCLFGGKRYLDNGLANFLSWKQISPHYSPFCLQTPLAPSCSLHLGTPYEIIQGP